MPDEKWKYDPYEKWKKEHHLSDDERRHALGVADSTNTNATCGVFRHDLCKAAKDGDYKQIKALIAAGADVNSIDCAGLTALIQGVGHVHVITVLIAAGSDVNLREDNDRTALMWAARLGIPESVNALLAAGATVLAKDKRGRTALD